MGTVSPDDGHGREPLEQRQRPRRFTGRASRGQRPAATFDDVTCGRERRTAAEIMNAVEPAIEDAPAAALSPRLSGGLRTPLVCLRTSPTGATSTTGDDRVVAGATHAVPRRRSMSTRSRLGSTGFQRRLPLWIPIHVPRRALCVGGAGRAVCVSGSVGRDAAVRRTCLYRILSPYYSRWVTADVRKPVGATIGRRYRSQLREHQAAATRRAVVDAATELFVANGWAATGMREVAAAAGVALETVYSHFSSKRGLLRAVADTAVVGDDASQPLAERVEFRAIGVGRRPERIRAAARLLAVVQARTAAIAKLLREAAAADQGIADMLQSTRERQRSRRGQRDRVDHRPRSHEVRARRRVGHRQPRGVPAACRGVGLDAPALRDMGRRNTGADHSALLTEGGACS